MSMPPKATSTKPDSETESPGKDSLQPRSPWLLILLFVMPFGMMLFLRSVTHSEHGPSIDYSSFYDFAQKERVSKILIQGQSIEGDFKAVEDVNGKKSKTFQTIAPERDDSLLPLLRAQRVQVQVVSDEPAFGTNLLWSVMPWVFILAVGYLLSRRAARNMGSLAGPLGGFVKGKARKFERAAQVNVTFDDVAGLKNAKRDLPGGSRLSEGAGQVQTPRRKSAPRCAAHRATGHR
jgi:cell division protease FtsH